MLSYLLVVKNNTGKNLKTAALLWFASSAATFLYVGHMANDPWKNAVGEAAGSPLGSFDFFISQFVLSSFILFVCSMSGALLAERYKLPGAADHRAILPLLKFAPIVVIVGLILGYLIHDRVFYEGRAYKGWPMMLPEGFGWSTAFIAYSVLNKEVFYRFGMTTFFAGLFMGKQNKWAVVATSAFAASMSMKELTFPGHTLAFDAPTVSVYAWALILNLFLGFVYLRKGLWVAMAARVCVDCRFLIYPILLLFRAGHSY